MYSKKIISHFLVSMALLSNAGCSKFLDGKKEKPEVIEFSDKRFVCLKSLPANLKHFSVGDSQAQEIESSVKCLQEALSYYQRKTQGSIEGAYTIEDMRRFFGKYFLKENNVSPEFANELMKVKRALLGGSDQFITKTEILQLVEMLDFLKEEAISISPHMKVLLNQTEQRRASWEQISAATEQARISLQRLLTKTQIAKSDYSFDQVKKVLTGFAEFIKGSENFAPYERYSDWLPMVESVKNILIGRNSHFSTQKEWSDSLDNLIDLYELLLRYHYVIKDVGFDNPAELRQLSQFIGQMLGLIEKSHQMKVKGEIPFQDIDALIGHALPRMTDEISVETIQEGYRLIVLKMLEPERQGDSRGLSALNRDHLASLRREFNIWRLSQSFVDHVNWDEKTGTLSKRELRLAFSKFKQDLVIKQGLSRDPLERKSLKDSWDDFSALMNGKHFTSFNKRGRFIEAYNPELYAVSWQSMTRFNLMKTITRFLMLGYGEQTSGKLTKSSLSEKGENCETGLVAWYDDFKKIGIELKAFDPVGGNSGGRSFLEANFFTPSGDGDNKMDFYETFEFVSLLFSSGLNSSNDLRGAMEKAQCATQDYDNFQYPMLNEVCFEKNLRRDFLFHFDNLPWMVRYVKGLNPDQWKEFYRDWLGAARVDNPTAGRIETGDIRTMVTLAHYVEAMMVIFDADKNGMLSRDELKVASLRFISFFKKLKPNLPDSVIREGFTYLVLYGYLPDGWDLVEFQWDKIMGNVNEAPRGNLLKVLKFLKDELKKVQKTDKSC